MDARTITQPSPSWFDKIRYEVVDLGHETPCWIWRLSLGRGGYGQVSLKRNGVQQNVRAHRLYYEHVHGPVPPAVQLHHKCDNQACVNPDHLEPVTSQEHSDRKPVSRRNRRLTPEQVSRIRTSGLPLRRLAAEMGVTYSAVRAVRIGKTYRTGRASLVCAARILALAAAVVLAAAPAVAQAHARREHHAARAAHGYVIPTRSLTRRQLDALRDKLPAHRPTRSRALGSTASRPPASPAPTTTAPAPVLGVGGAIPDGCSDAAGATVARVILYRYTPENYALDCASAAVAAGMKLIVSVQYAAAWSPQQITTWFQTALDLYLPLHPYAVSIGNEEANPQDGSQSPAAYSATWKMLEPLLAQRDPRALRIAGEISPWGLDWFKQAVQDGLPGAQVYAAHPYPASTSPWASDPAQFVQIATAQGVPAWATEGMCGPDAWMVYGCQPESVLAAAGFQMAIDWEATSGGGGT